MYFVCVVCKYYAYFFIVEFKVLMGLFYHSSNLHSVHLRGTGVRLISTVLLGMLLSLNSYSCVAVTDIVNIISL